VSSALGTNAAIEQGTSRTGRWLRARRLRAALWIAVVEAIVVVVFHDVSRWTVIGLSILAVLLYAAVGRESRYDTFRQLTWIFAFSQLVAVIAAIVAFIVLWMAIVAVAIFAVVALFYLFHDRG
jgi:hypothetical protein